MACTIVSTPALGASSWESFITQVAGLKRGFMELSLTNFASTAASAVATGGVIEVAGSFYVFSETAIDYSTTTSANADLYIYAQPSAGGTTCSIMALTAACVWVDSRQGFYASAASLNRAIGGVYVGTAGTYHTKFIYDAWTIGNCLPNNRTRPLLVDIKSLGEWNMDATTSQTIVTRPCGYKIRAARCTIMSDTSATYDFLDGPASAPGSASVGEVFWSQSQLTQIIVNRTTGGYYDGNPFFDGTASTVPNRGWVIYTYEA